MTKRFYGDDPRHGTAEQPKTAVVNGCQCEVCEDRRKYNRNRAKQLTVYGQRARLDREATVRQVKQVQTCLDEGWKLVEISEATGVAEGTLCDLLTGRSRTMYRETSEAIDRLARMPRPAHRVNPIPTLRRFQALARIGWPFREVCRRAGLSEGFASDLATDVERPNRRSTVSAEDARAVAAVYRQLAMTPAPPSRVNRAAATRAKHNNWPSPFAWDDIDDLNEKPKTGQRGKDGTYCPPKERRAALEEAVETGATVFDVLRDFGIDREALWKWCKTNDALDLYDTISARTRVSDNGWTAARRRRTEAAA